MRKKILSLLCCVFILLPLSACKEAVTQPSFNTELESEMPAETLIAENGSYRLELNRTNMGIILTDLSSGEQWGSSPVSSNGEELNEFGMPVKKHPQVESVGGAGIKSISGYFSCSSNKIPDSVTMIYFFPPSEPT